MKNHEPGVSDPEAGAGSAAAWNKLAWAGGILVFLLISGLIWVSTLKVGTAIRMFGEPTLTPGMPAASRMGVVDVDTGRFIKGAKFELALESSGKAIETRKGEVHGASTFGAMMDVPTDATEPARYMVKAILGDREESRVVDLHLRPGKPSNSSLARLTPTGDEEARVSRLEGESIDLYVKPESPALIPSMENTLIFRVTNAEGEPVTGVMELDNPKGRHRLNRFGLTSASVRPGFGRWMKIRVDVTADDGKKALFLVQLQLPPVQVKLTLDKRIVLPGDVIDVTVKTLRSNAEVYCDLWSWSGWIGTWAEPAARGRADFRVRIPPGLEGAALLQAYLNPYNPGRAHDERLLIVGDYSDACSAAKELARAGFKLPGAVADFARKSGEACNDPLALKLVLSAALAGFKPPPLLLDSLAEKSRELDRFKSRVRWVLGGMLGGGGALFLAIIYLVVIRHYRKGRISMAGEHNGPVDPGGHDDSMPAGAGVEMAALMGIILLALAGLVYLLVSLKWGL